MPFSDFKIQVAAFLNRDATTSLTQSGVDLILASTNRAMLWAQRSHDFEYCRVKQTLAVNGVTGGDLTTLPISIKKVERVFTAGGAQMDFTDRMTVINRYLRMPSIGGIAAEETRVLTPTTRQPATVYQLGTFLYMMFPLPPLYPTAASNYTFSLDTVKWQAPLVAAGDDNFFLTYCNDFMLFRTLAELNVYLKEDDRVKIDQDKMTEAWQAVISWDSSLTPTTTIGGTVES
jgi:hypothetical protein